MIKFIRDRVLKREFLAGTFCNLGSSVTVEIAGLAGFDWLLIDLEHGSGDEGALLYQLQAAAGTPAAVIVRVAWNDPVRFKRILDLGPAGLMVPQVNSPEEARLAVSAMRFPPAGIRGVARMNRASGFGKDFQAYFETANKSLLTVIQIESVDAVEQVEEIATVDGVDVLFVGPTDLTVNMGIPGEMEHPRYLAALDKVAAAARKAKKAAGLLLSKEEQIGPMLEKGFTFLALSSDGGNVAAGLNQTAKAFINFKK